MQVVATKAANGAAGTPHPPWELDRNGAAFRIPHSSKSKMLGKAILIKYGTSPLPSF